MKKKILYGLLIVIAAVHLAYFVVWPMVGWKPCGSLKADDLVYVNNLTADGAVCALSETEIGEFVDTISQFRVYPMPGNMNCVDTSYRNKFEFQRAGDSEAVQVEVIYPFFIYNGTAYRIDEKDHDTYTWLSRWVLTLDLDR